MASSTAGYWIEIGRWQPRQRARSAIQLTIGMFSYQVIARSQRGQRERGRTTDRLSGQREMQTFRNDPTAAPNRNAKPSTNGSGDIIEERTARFPSRRPRSTTPRYR